MSNEYRLHLNFLPIRGEVPSFVLYRKVAREQESRPNVDAAKYTLPISSSSSDRAGYWVQIDPAEGFVETRIDPEDNRYLTRHTLFLSLRSSVQQKLLPEQFSSPAGGFSEELDLVIEKHDEGQELLTVRPYFLGAKRQFGYLADFHFKRYEQVPFSRQIQRLSLSLDENFRRNLSYYSDRLAKITNFLERNRNLLESIWLPGASEPLELEKNFVQLEAKRLRSKVYQCGGRRESRSQFLGLVQNGPYIPLTTPPNLLFVFREQDRPAARTLALALRGSKQYKRYNFPGFARLFKSDIEIDRNPAILEDLSKRSISKALEIAKKDRDSGHNTLPVFILPEGEDNGYLEHKATFAQAGIPTQVCTTPTIQDDNTLKWSVANIALQIFCKSGGQPWLVRPTSDPTLIVGISQSHQHQGVGRNMVIEKYFAFSVMTDNSGLFQSLRVLGDSNAETDYLQQLRENLYQILKEGAQEFPRVVIHSSFKLKRAEVDAIQETVEKAASERGMEDCQFAFVKINPKSRFFGVNMNVNSLVPYESTAVRLGGREYLIWFEGIFPDKPTVTKAFPGPTHIQIMKVRGEYSIGDDVLLQDLVNLSGANWRGFNAKSAPVSVFYCHLVADMVSHFNERDLPLPQVKDLRPWFL